RESGLVPARWRRGKRVEGSRRELCVAAAVRERREDVGLVTFADGDEAGDVASPHLDEGERFSLGFVGRRDPASRLQQGFHETLIGGALEQEGISVGAYTDEATIG